MDDHRRAPTRELTKDSYPSVPSLMSSSSYCSLCCLCVLRIFRVTLLQGCSRRTIPRFTASGQYNSAWADVGFARAYRPAWKILVPSVSIAQESSCRSWVGDGADTLMIPACECLDELAKSDCQQYSASHSWRTEDGLVTTILART